MHPTATSIKQGCAGRLRRYHSSSIAAPLANGYRPDGDGHVAAQGQYGPWTPTGGGTLTTAADMARFMIAQLGDDPRFGAGVLVGAGGEATSYERLPWYQNPALHLAVLGFGATAC